MQVAYLLYDRFTALDITGPHDVFNSVPDVESIFVGGRRGPTGTSRTPFRSSPTSRFMR